MQFPALKDEQQEIKQQNNKGPPKISDKHLAAQGSI